MSLLDLLSNHFQNHLIKYVLTYPGNYKPIKSESQSLKLLIGRGNSEILLQTSVSKSQTIRREFSYLFMFYTECLALCRLWAEIEAHKWRFLALLVDHLDDELTFMYENGQGHLTLFCIVFVWLRGRPSTVRSPIQDPWFMYQNRLGPSGGIYYPNFVPCFVYHQLNTLPACLVTTESQYTGFWIGGPLT